MKRTKADKLRLSSISILKSKKLIIDLDISDGIENESDLENLIIKFESYINKYSKCGLKLNYRTNRLEKTNNIQKIASYIDSLSATKFEKFAALLIKIFGYELTYATKLSHDQGIDFIGVKNFKLFDSNRKSYLIGQAKKYKSLVNIDEVRSFAGSVLLLRNREFSQTKEVYKTVNMKSFTSVEGIFATSYFFSPPALTLCENSDIISLDFIDLVLLTEKAILNKELKIERNNIFIKSKADIELKKIEVMD